MAHVEDYCSQLELENLELLRRPRVHQLIWIAGGDRNGIRLLNRQVVLGREIIVSEDISLHLVTQDGKTIFLKPLPGGFFNNNGELELSGKPDSVAILRGFVWTYIMMVQSQTDFRIALEHHLLPSMLCPDGDSADTGKEAREKFDAAYKCWCLKRESWESSIMNGQAAPTFNNRFDRAELRLSRLNLIVTVCLIRLRGYQRLETTYAAHFQSFLAVISVVAFAFLSVILSAFQVAMAYTNVSRTVAAVGYWFSTAALIFVAATITSVCAWFAVVAVDNLTHASRHRS